MAPRGKPNSYQNYQVAWFNENFPVNQTVMFLDDDGAVKPYRVAAPAFLVGSGVYSCPLVKLSGFAEAQHLDRCVAGEALKKRET